MSAKAVLAVLALVFIILYAFQLGPFSPDFRVSLPTCPASSGSTTTGFMFFQHIMIQCFSDKGISALWLCDQTLGGYYCKVYYAQSSNITASAIIYGGPP